MLSFMLPFGDHKRDLIVVNTTGVQYIGYAMRVCMYASCIGNKFVTQLQCVQLASEF